MKMAATSRGENVWTSSFDLHVLQTYPHYTPYQYAGNEPIGNIDLDGVEQFKVLETVTFVQKVAPKTAAKAASSGGNITAPRWSTLYTSIYEYAFDKQLVNLYVDVASTGSNPSLF